MSLRTGFVTTHLTLLVSAAGLLAGCPAPPTNPDTGVTTDVQSNPDGGGGADVQGDVIVPEGGSPDVSTPDGSTPDAGLSARCPVYDNTNPTHDLRGSGVGIPALEHDETWGPDKVHYISDDFEVAEFNLRIIAGTTVCFSSEASGRAGSLRVTRFRLNTGGAPNTNGSLRIEGTADNHVVFSAEDDGYFTGLDIGQDYTALDIAYLDMIRPGSGFAAIRVGQTLVDQTFPAVRLNNVRLIDVEQHGLTLEDYHGLTADSTVRIEGYGLSARPAYEAIEASPEVINTLTPSMLSLGAGVPQRQRVIKLVGASFFDDSLHLQDLGLHYVISGDFRMDRSSGPGPSAPLLTIDPGVVIELSAGSLILGGGGAYSNAGGDLHAVGTPTNPIVFTSREATPAAGDWGAVIFNQTTYDPAISVLQNAVVEYAGGATISAPFNCQTGMSTYGAILVNRSENNGTYLGPTIDHVEVRDSAADGIVANCDTTRCIGTDYSDPSFSNTFTRVSGASQQALGCP